MSYDEEVLLDPEALANTPTAADLPNGLAVYSIGSSAVRFAAVHL
jgi:hypothetical protein